jgi:hypothetical protein
VVSQFECRAAPWGGPWSFYIFAEIFCPLPLGGEGGPPPAFSSAGAGRVRGWWACARPSAVHIAPLKALGNDHATSSTFSRNLGTALRCLWFQGIDPLTPRHLSPKRERGECRNSRGRPLGRPRPGQARALHPMLGYYPISRVHLDPRLDSRLPREGGEFQIRLGRDLAND